MISKPIIQVIAASLVVSGLSTLALARNTPEPSYSAYSFGNLPKNHARSLVSNESAALCEQLPGTLATKYDTANFSCPQAVIEDELGVSLPGEKLGLQENVYTCISSMIAPVIKALTIFGIFWGTGNIALGMSLMAAGLVFMTRKKQGAGRLVRWGGTAVAGGSLTGWLLGYGSSISLIAQEFCQVFPGC